MKRLKIFSLTLLTSAILTACGGGSSGSASDANNDSASTTVTHDLAKMRKVLNTNADIAYAAYSDSVTTAQALKTAIDTFAANPTQSNLDAAKAAWLVAREPYGQTEVYRFRASPIDDTDYNAANGEDGPEGAINAWPLGEALIDYTTTGNDFGDDQLAVTANGAGLNSGGAVKSADANIINTSSITINEALLQNSATAEDEHDVISGYHAIEFLLWGQDLNNSMSADTISTRDTAVKTVGAANMAAGGLRPLTDFTSDTYASRRLDYLKVAAQKLVNDLTSVKDAWATGAGYRTAFTTINSIDEGKAKFAEILTGMGTLSEGELAGERMQIALSSNSQEDEHSCFSDNTHRDIWLNAEGVYNSYYGTYAGYDSTLDGIDNVTSNAVNGYGFDDYLADIGQASLGTALATALVTTKTNYEAIDTKARAGKPVDVVIMTPMSDDAKPMRDTITSLNSQASKVQALAAALNITATVVDPDASACDTNNPTEACN